MRTLTCALVAALGLAAPAEAATAGKPYMLGVAVSGLVAKIVVDEGSHVKAGDLILQMDCRPLEAEIKVRKADLGAAEANYQRVKNGPRPEEVAIGEANVAVAQARAEEAADTFNRAKALTEGVTITRAQILEARRDARITSAQMNDAQKRLDLLHAGSRREDVDEAAARRDSAAAGVSLTEERLNQCSVRAPAAGTISLLVTPGQFISDAVPAPLAKLTPD